MAFRNMIFYQLWICLSFWIWWGIGICSSKLQFVSLAHPFFFFFSFHMVSALSACTIPLLVPSPSKVKVSHDRICVPGNEWICPLKFHSHMQTHFYQKCFSQLIFPQTKLSKKENHKYFQRTLFWALALQNYHIIKRHLWNRLLFHSFICLFPWNILSTCMLFVI